MTETTPRSDRAGLLFILLLIVTCAALMATHLLVADDCLSVPPIVDGVPIVVPPDRLAVTYEVMVHGLLGITCRMAFMAGQSSLTTGINFVQMTILWLSTAMFGCGMVLALVFMLRVLSLHINGLEVGLGYAQIETIASIAFVLGFFNETPRRLLALVRDAVRPAK